jgi:hypothetical protein
MPLTAANIDRIDATATFAKRRDIIAIGLHPVTPHALRDPA